MTNLIKIGVFAVFAAILTACASAPSVSDLLNAANSLSEANADFRAAAVDLGGLAKTDEGKQALSDLTNAIGNVQDAIQYLEGNAPVGESCSSRCHHECDDPVSQLWCTLNCSSKDCHPSCCGCPGTYINGSCDGCKSPSGICGDTDGESCSDNE